MDLCDSEGIYIVRSVARALWMIDGHHETLASVASRNPSVPALPATWMPFDKYNAYRGKKIKKSQLSAKSMHECAQLLFGKLGKPVLRKPFWGRFTKVVEGLAMVLENYSVHLNQQATSAKARQSLDHVIRPLSQVSDCEVRPADESRLLSKEEVKLEARLNVAG